MKKIMIAIAAIALGISAQAAQVKWGGANVYSSDLTTKLAVGSTVDFYGALVTEGVGVEDKLVDSLTVATAGSMAGTRTVDAVSANETGNFYFVVEDNGKAFTSAVKENVTITAVGATSVAFGNMASATQNASNWAAVPERTSGLLVLLGMAGLALRRRRA